MGVRHNARRRELGNFLLLHTAESLQGGLRAIGGESEVVVAGLAGALDYIFTVILETGIAGLLLSAAHRKYSCSPTRNL
jgi:hypothetical protein